jgi:integrase
MGPPYFNLGESKTFGQIEIGIIGRKDGSMNPLMPLERLPLLYTGQRRSDVVGFGRQNVREGKITFTQKKGKNRHPITLTIPLLPQLQEILDASKTGHMVFLTTAFGRPFTSNGFGNRFRKWCILLQDSAPSKAMLRHCSSIIGNVAHEYSFPF